MSTPTSVIISRVKSSMKVSSTSEKNAAVDKAAKEFRTKFNGVATIAVREAMDEYHLLAEDAHLASYEGGLEIEEKIHLDFLSYLLDELVLETT